MQHVLVSGRGEAILFGHSYLWDHKMWQPQIDCFQNNYTCITPDLFGHGESSQLPSNVNTLDDLAEEYAKLMQIHEKFILVGLSIGGMWGARLAALYPNKIKALILMDTYLGHEENTDDYLALLDKVSQGVDEDLAEDIAGFFLTESSQHRNAFKEYLKNLPKDKLPTILKLGKMIFQRPNAMHLLEKIKNIPTAIIVGEKDIPRPPAESFEMARILGISATVIPDAAHIVTLDNPEATNQAIKNFLMSVS